jgi:Domain of unknown function (DUF4157)
MRKEHMLVEENKSKPTKPKQEAERQLAEHQPAEGQAAASAARSSGLVGLHRHIGNQGVQRLLAQRSSGEPAELDQETADRIERERGSGQPLDTSLQARMGEALETDLSQVQVHTSPQADSLNQRLGARAFTTGRDVFFREGAYDPHSSAGQELITHELAHVVQQGSGAAGGSGRMMVNAPGDAFEQEADATAKAVTGAQAGSQVQRQEVPEEEEVQTKALLRQEWPEEEEVQTKALQEQAVPEEEEVQAKALQQQPVPEEEEEEVQTKLLQRQEVPEEEEQL